ncbi:MAG: fumarate hydratase, partial [Proteobacteria bacterium]|nr:fumarate hydratase [Pseudomonadota bacterium]
MSDYRHHPLFAMGDDATPYRRLTGDYVSVDRFDGQDVLKVDAEALKLITFEAFKDISHLLRPDHLKQLAGILDDPEASDNDRFVAMDLLKN